jgi:hypothetical protein
MARSLPLAVHFQIRKRCFDLMGDLGDHFLEFLLLLFVFFKLKCRGRFQLFQLHQNLGGNRLLILLAGRMPAAHDLFRVTANLRREADKPPAVIQVAAEVDKKTDKNDRGDG